MNNQDRLTLAAHLLRANYTIVEVAGMTGLGRSIVEDIADGNVEAAEPDRTACRHVLCSNRSVARGVCARHYRGIQSAAQRFARKTGAA